jgi:putative transposase
MILTYKFNYTHKKLSEMAKISKDIFNQTNYIIKTELNKTNTWIRYNKLDKIMKITTNLENTINYQKLKAQTSQQIIKQVDNCWDSYFKALKQYKKTPNKFKSIPKPPNYKPKNGKNIIFFTNQNCQIKNNTLILSKDLQINIPKYKNFKSFKCIRIIPKYNDDFEIEIVYEQQELHQINSNKIASIDLGVNTLAAVTSEDFCLLYNGKQLKSISQYTHKQIAYYQSKLTKNKMTKNIRRLYDLKNNKIKDLLHKTSTHIIHNCVKHNIGTIIVGYNAQWKTSTDNGNVNNQMFCSIPHKKFLNMLQYKAKLNGITVITNEESYTSLCDSLALESIGFHNTYAGKRIHRGLFKSNTNKLINADINGSLNIMRKVVCDSYVSGIIDRGLLFNPVKISDLNRLKTFDKPFVPVIIL